MRHMILAGLIFAAVVPAAAQQGEIIIRRPGVPDRVIRLDSSAASRDEIAKVESHLRELKSTLDQRMKELPTKSRLSIEPLRAQAMSRDLHEKLTESIEPLRTRTLALREKDFPTAAVWEPMVRSLAATRRSPYLGILVKTEPAETDKYGAYIEAVTPATPAERAGIRSGDIITRMAGKSLAARDSKEESNPGLRLIEMIATLTVGKPTDVELRRGNQTMSVKVTPNDNGGAIARMAPSIAEISRMPNERMAGEISLRGVQAAPGYNVFANGSGGAYSYSFGGNGLFSNIELTSLNEKLGNYFGTTEGVLVVNIGASRQVYFTPSTATGGRGGVSGFSSGRIVADSIRVGATARQGGSGGGGRAGSVGAGRTVDTVNTITRGGMVSRRIDSNAVYIDGVPLARDMVARKAFTMGLEPGDVIVSVDGRKVTSPSQLMRIVGTYEHNDEFKLQIMRQKRAETLTVKMP